MPRTKRSKAGAKQRAENINKNAAQDPILDADRANYVLFWKPSEDEAGWASQWWDELSFTSADGSVKYRTTEHYMMSEKARLFEDKDVLEQILNTASPNEVRKLGRTVANFDEDIWSKERLRIVEEGNELKFRQHASLREKLLGTGNKTMVEASPRDRIWGIGFGAKNALSNKDKWGLNLLGQALMNVRAKLRAEEPSG